MVFFGSFSTCNIFNKSLSCECHLQTTEGSFNVLLLRIQMVSNIRSSRDQHTTAVNLWVVTNLWEMNEIIYLSHDWTELYQYFSNLCADCARWYSFNLSSSLPIIFTSKFLSKNGIATTFSTKMFRNSIVRHILAQSTRLFEYQLIWCNIGLRVCLYV